MSKNKSSIATTEADLIKRDFFNKRMNYPASRRSLFGISFYIYSNYCSIYIRDGAKYMIQNELTPCLVIANMEIDEKMQNQGIGSSIIFELMKFNPYEIFMMECVHNLYLREWLLKQGFSYKDELQESFIIYT